jgi:prepilin-type processing-associated H-X9-DG protein
MLEAVVVLFSLFILVSLLLPVLSAARVPSGVICVNRLHQIGMAFSVWQGDNNGKFPMNISAASGGAMEAASAGNATAVFQVMSNELNNPRVLICPADKYHKAAASFDSKLTTKNVSYFVSVDASTNNSETVLSGDDNFEISHVPVKSGLFVISSNTSIAWFIPRHKFYGNILFADGSIQGVSGLVLKTWLRPTNAATTRLAIP